MTRTRVRRRRLTLTVSLALVAAAPAWAHAIVIGSDPPNGSGDIDACLRNQLAIGERPFEVFGRWCRVAIEFPRYFSSD